MSDSRYPIGTFKLIEDALTTAERQAHIQQLANLPAQLAAVVASAGNKQMQHSYRPGGWTRHQVVHHLADSHLHGYTRFRWALTENNPTVQPYNEKEWAELADVPLTPVAVSLSLLAALHARWVTLLRHLCEEQWHRTFYRPDMKRTYTLDQALALYALHGQHHQGHVASLYQSDS